MYFLRMAVLSSARSSRNRLAGKDELFVNHRSGAPKSSPSAQPRARLLPAERPLGLPFFLAAFEALVYLRSPENPASTASIPRDVMYRYRRPRGSASSHRLYKVAIEVGGGFSRAFPKYALRSFRANQESLVLLAMVGEQNDALSVRPSGYSCISSPSEVGRLAELLGWDSEGAESYAPALDCGRRRHIETVKPSQAAHTLRQAPAVPRCAASSGRCLRAQLPEPRSQDLWHAPASVWPPLSSPDYVRPYRSAVLPGSSEMPGGVRARLVGACPLAGEG